MLVALSPSAMVLLIVTLLKYDITCGDGDESKGASLVPEQISEEGQVSAAGVLSRSTVLLSLLAPPCLSLNGSVRCAVPFPRLHG